MGWLTFGLVTVQIHTSKVWKKLFFHWKLNHLLSTIEKEASVLGNLCAVMLALLRSCLN